MKKKSKKKKGWQALWPKILLTILLVFMIVLAWVVSRPASTSHQGTGTPAPRDQHKAEADIAQVIKPLLDDAYVLTFEDELPDPVFQGSTKPANEQPARHRHVLSLIIDDVGYDLRALERLLALPYTITVSVLPDAPYARQAAQMAYQHGATVMLHMPMQTTNPKYQKKMEKFYLSQDMDKQTFTTVFEDALAKVPHAVGINNHMGSALTADETSMRWLMELCQKHGLFFIDSRTSASSVAAKMARQLGVAWNTRDIFLDHSVSPDALQHAWASMLSCVKRNDHCIMLAHPHKETLDFLEKQAQGLSPQSFVSITETLQY